jgi:hypothetical protein
MTFSTPMPELWLSETQKRYPLYLALHATKNFYTPTQRTKILGEAMGGRSYPWRVVGVTKAALSGYKKRNFDRSAQRENGIRRAHIFPRKETAEILLSPEKPLSVEQVAQLQWDRDMTLLCVKGENKDNFDLGLMIPMPNPDWALFSGRSVGWAFGNPEQQALRELAQIHNISE